MKFDLREIAKENPSKASYTAVANWIIENTQVGEHIIISSIIGLNGVEVGPKHIRPFINQRSIAGQKFSTRFVGGELHIWRVA